MTRRVVTIPRAMMRSTARDWDIDWRGKSAGTTNDGFGQVVVNAPPRWIGSPQLLLHGPALQVWSSIRLYAQGRAGVFRVPMVELVGQAGPASVLWDGDLPFEGGGGWAYEPFVVTTAGADAGAEEIAVSDPDVMIEPALLISHDDWPYRVIYRSAVTGVVRVGIQPPLRRAIPSGATISLRACGLFEATDDTMGRPVTGMRHIAAPQLSFREWLNRP